MKMKECLNLSVFYTGFNKEWKIVEVCSKCNQMRKILASPDVSDSSFHPYVFVHSILLSSWYGGTLLTSGSYYFSLSDGLVYYNIL